MASHSIKKQEREERLAVVAKLYKRGYSLSQIREGVKQELNVTVSKVTIMKDVNKLLAEWRSERVGDIDDYVELELRRIDMACSELWEQWEKSKADYNKTKSKAIGVGSSNKNDENGNGKGNDIVAIRREQTKEEVITFGNPAYIAEIRQQLAERRKLLGLYAPEKREINGSIKADLDIQSMSEDEIRAEIERIHKSNNNK